MSVRDIFGNWDLELPCNFAVSNAFASASIFVGLPVTYESFVVGLKSYQYWKSAMTAFRELSAQLHDRGLPSFPEEILLMIENYLKVDSIAIGEEEYLQRSDTGDYDDCERGDCACRAYKRAESSYYCPHREFADSEIKSQIDHHAMMVSLLEAEDEYMLQEFNLCIVPSPCLTEPGHTPDGKPKNVYLCIPWDHTRVKEPDGILLTHTGEPIPSDWFLVQTSKNGSAGPPHVRSSADDCFIDQDLSVTREKTLLINKAFRDLDLTVCDFTTVYR